jgi:hypothetical protein
VKIGECFCLFHFLQSIWIAQTMQSLGERIIKMSKRIIQFTVICTFTVLIAGCQTTFNTYKFQGGAYNLCKSDSPTNKVGILLVNDGGEAFSLHSIDGCSPPDSAGFYPGGGWYSGIRIELLPGEHTISVGFIVPGARSLDDVTITFQVEAGKMYHVVRSTEWPKTVGGSIGTWTAWIEELYNGEIKKGDVPQLTQPDQAAEIYFICESGAPLVKYHLFLDGIDFFQMRPHSGRYTIVKADPGKHLVGALSFGGFAPHWNQDIDKFVFQPNQKYYFNVTDSGTSALLKVVLLSAIDGEAKIKKCTYVPYKPSKSGK